MKATKMDIPKEQPAVFTPHADFLAAITKAVPRNADGYFEFTWGESGFTFTWGAAEFQVLPPPHSEAPYIWKIVEVHRPLLREQGKQRFLRVPLDTPQRREIGYWLPDEGYCELFEDAM